MMVMLRVGQAWACACRFALRNTPKRTCEKAQRQRFFRNVRRVHGVSPQAVLCYSAATRAPRRAIASRDRIAQYPNALDPRIQRRRPAGSRRVAATRPGWWMPLPPNSLSADQAVPAGVPVMMTMPGLRVKLREKK